MTRQWVLNARHWLPVTSYRANRQLLRSGNIVNIYLKSVWQQLLFLLVTFSNITFGGLQTNVLKKRFVRHRYPPAGRRHVSSEFACVKETIDCCTLIYNLSGHVTYQVRKPIKDKPVRSQQSYRCINNFHLSSNGSLARIHIISNDNL